MGTFTTTEVRARASKMITHFGAGKSASSILLEESKQQKTAAAAGKVKDIFLSHSFRDALLILGVKLMLEDYGFSVYVDWLDDPELDRANVSKETARMLRGRMNACKCLLFATTPTSSESKWMPWECGYFDGKKNRVAILPVTASEQSSFSGQEYLGIYPYVLENQDTARNDRLWVHESVLVYCALDEWLRGVEPTKK